MTSSKKIPPQELEALYHGICIAADCEAEFTTNLVGSVPADDKGLEMFCIHHLGLRGDPVREAVARIKREEIGERALSPDGEVKEAESYGVNVIRRDSHGPYLGMWQIKACIKCAAQRIGLFQKKRGSKGDMAHLGQIEPLGASRMCEAPDHIHLYTVDHDGFTIIPAKTSFKKFMGSVQGPQGRVSIVHDSETAPPGSRFAFRLRVPCEFYDEDAIRLIFATIPVIGLGGVKALESGKFKILSLSYVDPMEGNRKGKGKLHKED